MPEGQTEPLPPSPSYAGTRAISTPGLDPQPHLGSVPPHRSPSRPTAPQSQWAREREDSGQKVCLGLPCSEGKRTEAGRGEGPSGVTEEGAILPHGRGPSPLRSHGSRGDHHTSLDSHRQDSLSSSQNSLPCLSGNSETGLLRQTSLKRE